MNATRKLLAIVASLALLSILLASFYAAGAYTYSATPSNSVAVSIVGHIRGALEGTAGWIGNRVGGWAEGTAGIVSGLHWTLDGGHHHHHDDHGCDCPNDIGSITFSFDVRPGCPGEGTSG
jgi:hypothetical protein